MNFSYLPLPLLLCLGLCCGEAASAAPSPNYLVSGYFTSSGAGDVYSVQDFNDQGMVCGTWKRTDKDTGREEAGGVFVWQDGVMRKITPPQAGIAYIELPTAAQGSRVGGSARMTNVRPDGTFLLAAPALQTKSTPNGVQPVYRIIVYTLTGDLAGNASPVISGRVLGGFIRPDFYGKDLNFEDSSDVRDVTEDGTVLGYPSSWNFSFTPTQIWYPSGGHAPRYFDLDLRRTLGSVSAFDHAGRIIGTAADANAPIVSFKWDAPLAGLTPTAAADKTVWPSQSGFYGEQGDGSLISGLPYAHGEFRAIPNMAATAVWANRYQDIKIIQQFTIHHMASMPGRAMLTKSGHALGLDLVPGNPEDSFGEGYALARRNALDGSYSVRKIRDEMAPGYKLYPPFEIVNFDPRQYYDQAVYPLAINANLDILGSYTLEGVTHFYVLKSRPSVGRVRFEPSLSSADEASGQARLILRRTLGATGPATVRVTLGAGGTAVPGQDFAAGRTTVVSWSDGEAGAKTVLLPIYNDYIEEPEETVNVILSELTGSVLEGSSSAFLPIEDDLDMPGAIIPFVSGPLPELATVGRTFSYNPGSTAGTWAPVWSAEGLPDGLSMDPLSGLIMGEPKTSGTFNVVLTAKTHAGSSPPFTVNLQIAPAPADAPLFQTGPSTASATAGVPFTYQAGGTGSNIEWSFFWSNPPPNQPPGLPPGFTFNAATGQLAGTFAENLAGTVKIQVLARRGNEVVARGLEVAVAPSSGGFTTLQRWLADNNKAFAGAAGHPGLDADGNGYGNMLEFALGITPGMNPLEPVVTNGFFTGAPVPGIPSSFQDTSTSPRQTAVVFRSKAARDRGVAYTVEFSSDLAKWDRAVTYQIKDQGPAGDIIHVPDPNPGPVVGDPRYWRLDVSAP